MAEGNSNAEHFKTDTFVLVDVPEVEDKINYLTDYLEAVLGETVRKLTFHTLVPARVLVKLAEEIDLSKAESAISEEKFEGKYLRVEQAEMMNAVIVEEREIKEKLTLEFLKLYLQSEFADGEEVVTNCIQIPHSADVAVHFTDALVTRKVLECETHTPLPTARYTIKIKPFFSNFHGLIPYEGKYFLQALEKTCDSTIEKNQNRNSISSEEKADKKYKAEADLVWDIDMTQDDEDGKVKERPFLRSSETNFHSMSYLRAEGNFAVPLQYSDMGNEFSSMEYGKGNRVYMETSSNPKTVTKTRPDSQLPSSDHQIDSALIGPFNSLTVTGNNSKRNRRAPKMNITAKADQATETKSDGKTGFTLNRVRWKLMKDKIRNENWEVTYDDEKETLWVEDKDISCFKKSFNELSHCIKEQHIKLDEKMEKVFTSQYAKDTLRSTQQNVQWIIDKGYIKIYGFDDWSQNYIKGKINEIIDNFEEIIIPNTFPNDHFMWCKNYYERFYPVHISSDASFVTIVGKRDDVGVVKKSLDDKSNVISHQELGRQLITYSLQLPEAHYSLLMFFYGAELSDILKNVSYSWKTNQGEKCMIEFIGSFTHVERVRENLTAVQMSIQTEVIDVLQDLGSYNNLTLIQRLSPLKKSDPLAYEQTSFQTEFKCIIKNVVKTDRSSPASGSVQYHRRDPNKQKCSFRICVSTELEIKNYGNIVEEQSDVLVCFVPRHKKLASTFVGQAFLKVIPDLEIQADSLKSSGNEMAFTMLNIPGKRLFAVALMILPMFPDQASFRQKVQEVLSKASIYGAHSVCFPPLGHGRVMRYPDDFISTNFLIALQFEAPTLSSSCLEKVTFLATNKDLYERMKHQASTYFFPILKDHKSEELDESFAVIEEKANGQYDLQEDRVEIRIIHRSVSKIAPLWKLRLVKLIRGTSETPV